MLSNGQEFEPKISSHSIFTRNIKYNCLKNMKNSSDENISNVGLYNLERTLGTGATGKVKLARHSKTGEEVGVKIIKKELFYDKPTLRLKVQREISVMKLMFHPHVIKIFDVLEDSKYLFCWRSHRPHQTCCLGPVLGLGIGFGLEFGCRDRVRVRVRVRVGIRFGFWVRFRLALSSPEQSI